MCFVVCKQEVFILSCAAFIIKVLPYIFGCHGNTCYVIFIGAIFYMIYSTGKINVLYRF